MSNATYVLSEPIEAAELGPDGEVVTAMIDFTPGHKLEVERQQVTEGGVTETVFSAMRLPCGLHGTGPDGEDEWLGPFRYMTVNLPMLAAHEPVVTGDDWDDDEVRDDSGWTPVVSD